MTMDKAIKAQWIADLRSGEYKQGTAALERNGKFCCLGVLCSQAAKAGVVKRIVPDDDDMTHYGDAYNVLPEEVGVWAGVTESDPGIAAYLVPQFFSDYGEARVPLWRLNDRFYLTFEEIADLIEQDDTL